MLQSLLCTWYVYMAALAGLATLSVRPNKAPTVLAVAVVVTSAVLAVSLFRPFMPSELGLALKGVTVVCAALLVAVARRADSRHIAVLLVAAAVVPVLAHLYVTPP
jgi:hypothetical protein